MKYHARICNSVFECPEAMAFKFLQARASPACQLNLGLQQGSLQDQGRPVDMSKPQCKSSCLLPCYDWLHLWHFMVNVQVNAVKGSLHKVPKLSSGCKILQLILQPILVGL